jgi:hypothetical protein
VALNTGEVFDDFGNAFKASHLSGFTVQIATATVTNFSMNKACQPSTNTFTINYKDDVAIDAATIDVTDIVITGPSGTLHIISVSLDSNVNGPTRTATYTYVPPGGS